MKRITRLLSLIFTCIILASSNYVELPDANAGLILSTVETDAPDFLAISRSQRPSGFSFNTFLIFSSMFESDPNFGMIKTSSYFSVCCSFCCSICSSFFLLSYSLREIFVLYG